MFVGCIPMIFQFCWFSLVSHHQILPTCFGEKTAVEHIHDLHGALIMIFPNFFLKPRFSNWRMKQSRFPFSVPHRSLPRHESSSSWVPQPFRGLAPLGRERPKGCSWSWHRLRGGRGVMADRCKEMMKIYNRWYMIYNSVILGSIICWMVFFLEEFWRWHDRCSFSGRKELSNLSQNMARQPVKEPPPWCVCEQALKVGNMRQFCMMKQVAPLVAFYKTMIYIILHPKAANWFSKNWGTLPQLPQKHHWMRQRNVVLRATSAWAAAR